MVEYLPSKQVVAGSSPVFRSIKTITPFGVIVFMEDTTQRREPQSGALFRFERIFGRAPRERSEPSP